MPIRGRNQERKQQAIPAGMHGRSASIRVSESRISGRLQPGLGETLETFLTGGCTVDRCGPDAAELRTDAAAGRTLANAAALSGGGEADDLPGIYRRRSGSPETPSAQGTRPVLQPSARGVPTPNDVESFECVHLCIQGTGAHPAIQSHCQAGRIPRSRVLTLALACGAVSASRPFPTSVRCAGVPCSPQLTSHNAVSGQSAYPENETEMGSPAP